MKIILIITMFLFSTVANAKDVYVHGYMKNNGTYVQPHYRTAPDRNTYNNYSSKGTINPYTGQEGYVEPSYKPKKYDYDSNDNFNNLYQNQE